MARLSKEQKNEAVLIASVGCDRNLAARYVGCTIDDLVEEALKDKKFAKALLRAEATAELTHMRNIQQAAKEGKNWRASVWWLERKLPHLYGKKSAGEISRREMIRFLRSISDSLSDSVQDPADRQRVMEQLDQIATQFSDPLLLENMSKDSEIVDE